MCSALPSLTPSSSSPQPPSPPSSPPSPPPSLHSAKGLVASIAESQCNRTCSPSRERAGLDAASSTMPAEDEVLSKGAEVLELVQKVRESQFTAGLILPSSPTLSQLTSFQLIDSSL